jgi:hypothetical protein
VGPETIMPFGPHRHQLIVAATTYLNSIFVLIPYLKKLITEPNLVKSSVFFINNTNFKYFLGLLHAFKIIGLCDSIGHAPADRSRGY